MLPPAVAQKPVVTAGDQLRAVLQLDLPRRLDARPLVEHLGLHEAPVLALAPRADDPIANCQVFELSVAPVCHQHERLAGLAISTGMATSPVRIDRPPKRHLRRRRHFVEHRLGPHLVEARVERLGGVESAYRCGIAVSRQARSACPPRSSGCPSARTYVRIRAGRPPAQPIPSYRSAKTRHRLRLGSGLRPSMCDSNQANPTEVSVMLISKLLAATMVAGDPTTRTPPPQKNLRPPAAGPGGSAQSSSTERMPS